MVRTGLKKKVKIAKFNPIKKKASLTVKIAMPSESTLRWSPAWRHTPVIPALGRWNQKGEKFQVLFSCTAN